MLGTILLIIAGYLLYTEIKSKDSASCLFLALCMFIVSIIGLLC